VVSVRFFALAAALATAAFALLALGQGSADKQAFEEARVEAVARATAWISVQEYLREDDDAEGATQRFIDGVKKNVPGVEQALVLKGTKFLAHSTADLSGKRLDRDSLADKSLYDAGARLKALVRKNLDEKDRNKELKGFAWPEHEVETDKGVIEVRLPAKLDDDFRSLVQVRATKKKVSTGFPLALLLIALGFAVLWVPAGLKLTRVPAVAAGAVLLVVLVALQTSQLVSWRDGVRQQLAETQAGTWGQLVSAGLLDETAPEELEGMLPWLAQDRVGQASLGLRSIQKGKVEVPAGDVPFSAGDVTVTYAQSYFEEASDKDASDLTQWALGVALLALLTFALGSLGHLGRAGRAVVEHRTAYTYLSPAAAGMIVLVFVPVVFGIVLGFMQRSYNVFEFSGFANYIDILSDFAITEPTNFYFKLAVTVMWTVTNVVSHVVIGLFLALLLNDQMLKARGAFRVLLIVPWALPNYITALIWRGMFHKQFGAINAFIEAMGGEPIAWFQTFWPAFFTNLATNMWLGFPFMMVVSLGALQSIPSDLYEAAIVDGANRWQRFWKITLPLLMPALVPAVIVGTVWTFNSFNIIYLVSAGAPNGATDILITDAFRWAFERDRYGYAAAYSTIIFLILLIFTTITNRITGATKGAFE
jgi:ABC-type sugar transport system permease subunit